MTPSFTTTLDRLQSPHLFPLRLLAPTSLKFTPTCLTSTFRVTFTTPINTTPFKYKGTVFGGRKKGRIKIIKSELNAVGDDKGATDATEEKAARAALEQLDSQLSALAEKKVFKERNTEYLVSDQEKAFNEAGIKRVEWPEFSPGFLAFAGIGLLLLTIVNNILFNIFVGPPVRKRTPASMSNSSNAQFDYKVESREAPPLTNNR